ncbi:MAG: alpha/beta fold hydrolase [Alphaproteobacteria bacterium]
MSEPATGFEPPPFRARAPWWGADLQTLRNTLVDQGTPLPGERLLIDTADGCGDRLQAVVNRPDAPEDKPLVFMVHGLSGCEDSAYMLHAARHWLDRGHAVMRLNLRGAGPSRRTCKTHFHAGRSEDIAAGLDAVPADLAARGIFAIGFSIGGNCLLKHAGEAGDRTPVRAFAAVSAPIDMVATSAHIGRPRAWPYQRFLLTRFVAECLGEGALFSAEEREILRRARDFRELDDRFVAPRHGFDGVDDYYRRARAINVMAGIRRPTLVLHAKDDPVVPAASLAAYDWAQNRMLTPLVTPAGGHVGFHARDGAWHLTALDRFFRAATVG